MSTDNETPDSEMPDDEMPSDNEAVASARAISMDGAAAPDDPSRDDANDEALTAAGSRLRGAAAPLSGDAIAVTALRKSEQRARRRSRFAAAACVAALAAAGLAWTTRGETSPAGETAAQITKPGDAKPRSDAALAKAQLLVSKLDAAPVDPTKVKLTAKVRSYAGCPELLSDLQQVGAEHVGSRGFGGTSYFMGGNDMRQAATGESVSLDVSRSAPSSATDVGETIGTNVQVSGVDELDMVKAVGTKVYRLLSNRLFIVDTTSKAVVGYLPLDTGDKDRRSASAQSLLIAGNKLLVIGSESVQSEPIPGDPSAATSSHQFVTLTTVDVADPAKPTVTERVRIAGNLVSARLVKDQVRLVTGSSLPDIGFVMPTSPESIPVALEQNRLAVASSAIGDWIPAWDTGAGTQATPLVSCDKVTMPETFAGVSMTSMAQFTLGQPFAPSAMGLLAPSTDVYATATDVTVASNIWVDPAQQANLEFKDWQTAVHHYRFAADGPAYVGSAAVDGSVTGQFAFGQVGDRLGVVASAGTPWELSSTITLHLFDTATNVNEVGTVADIGAGAYVSGVRFTPKRVVVSTGTYAPDQAQTLTLHVVDVSNAAAPRKAGEVALTGSAGYLHPTDDTHAIAIGSATEKVSENNHIRVAVAEAIDLTNADSPTVTGSWKVSNASSVVENDHHGFLWWASKSAFGFGLQRHETNPKGPYPPPVGVMVSAAGGALDEIGQATPIEVDAQPSCAVTTADDLGVPDQLKIMISPESKLLLCSTPAEVPRFPGYLCSNAGAGYGNVLESAKAGDDIDEDLVARAWICGPEGPPPVERMLVVDGGLWMLTTESLEKVNADTMASETVIPVG